MIPETLLREAAAKRLTGVAERADRPRQRRSAEEPTSAARVSVRVRDLELREANGGDTLQFRGYASVTEAGYEMWDWYGPYTEVVRAGAFADTLALPGLDVPLVLQHQDLRRIARTTNGTLHLEEDTTGLLVEASLDPADSDVAYIVPKLRSGLIDEMSFKFMITAGQWTPDYLQFDINAVDINRGDVAIVGYGANPATSGAGLRAVDDPRTFARGLDDTAARDLHRELTARLNPKTGRDIVRDEDLA